MTTAPPPPPAPPSPSPPPRDAPRSALQQLIRAQSGTPASDATAYLRGGAHLDQAFRDAVIEELVEHPYRVPPPSFGIDLVAVLKDCFAARRQALLRGVLLLAVPLVLYPVSPLPLALTLIMLWLRLYYVVVRKLTGWLERLAVRLAGAGVQRAVRIVIVLLWLFLALYVVVAVAASLTGIGELAALSFSSESGPSYPYPYDGGYTYPGASPTSDLTSGNLSLTSLLLMLAGWAAVVVWDRYRAIRTLHALGSKQAPVPADGQQGPLYQRIRQHQADPDVVYGDYAPFVGAGIEIDHWSFAVELVRDPDGEPTAEGEFTVPAVHECLRRELARLGGDRADYPGDRMHGVAVLDYVFKSGFRLGPTTDWNGTGPGTAFARMAPYAARETAPQPDEPVAPSWWMDSLDLAAEERLRHYLAVRVNSWNDEVTLTVFTRVQIQGGLLYLENRAFVLPPVSRAYHAIDTTLLPSDALDWAGLAVRSLFSSFGLVARAVPDLYAAARTIVRTARQRAWYDRMCRANRPVDHGPVNSVRELGAEAEYQQLFQEMDVQRFRKSVAMRTLTGVGAALRAYGFQTGAYDAQRNVVINGNVYGNMQVGNHNTATHQHITTPEPRIGSQQN